MILFGLCVGYPEKFERIAYPGIATSIGSEPHEILALPSNGRDIFPVYAEILRYARETKPEFLVLMHDDLEWRDPLLAAKIREVFAAEPDVAILGLVGSRGGTGFPWWDGKPHVGRTNDLLSGRVDHGFDQLGYSLVDSMDGMCLVLSPWAIENLTLERLGYCGFHGYDADLCAQVKHAGKRAAVADIRAKHHSVGGPWTVGPFGRAGSNYHHRWHAVPKTDRYARMIEHVREAGTDSLSHFGNGYTHEGDLYLQQNPEEFASLVILLQERQSIGTYLEIGSASGGVCSFIREHVGYERAVSIDDGRHPRAGSQATLLEGVTRFVGDSHSPEATRFVRDVGPIDVAFIDGDHSYAGVIQDIELVAPLCNPGSWIVLHDTVACEGVARAWRELLESGQIKKIAEYIGEDRPLGIAVGEVL